MKIPKTVSTIPVIAVGADIAARVDCFLDALVRKPRRPEIVDGVAYTERSGDVLVLQGGEARAGVV